MRARSHLRLVSGLGIRGDANASEPSPRQVLLVDSAVYADLSLPNGALRENLLVSGLEAGQLESGQVLVSSRGVELRLMMPCEPCKKLNAVRKGLAGKVAERRGILARVLQGGIIKKGDQFTPLERRLPAFPDEPYDRILFVVKRIPEGKVSTFTHLAATSGLPAGYVRVIPGILKRVEGEIPAHRVVTSRGELIEHHLPAQRSTLRAEGVPVAKGSVLRQWIWEGDPFNDVEISI